MIFPIDRALYKEGHLAILKGNLAEDGAVAKITGLKNPVITAARVFDDEQSAMDAILGDRIRAGDILVLRYLGPKGGPACRKCSRRRRRSSASRRISRLHHGRPLLGRHLGMVVGHVAPEAFVGGTIALVQEGDSITIDAHRLLLQLNVDDAELARRRAHGNSRRHATRARRAREIRGARPPGEPGRRHGLIRARQDMRPR